VVQWLLPPVGGFDENSTDIAISFPVRGNKEEASIENVKPGKKSFLLSHFSYDDRVRNR
jgi:hypothetical protein